MCLVILKISNDNINVPSSVDGWTDGEWILFDVLEAVLCFLLCSVTERPFSVSSSCDWYKWNMSPYWDLLLDGAFFFPLSSFIDTGSSLLEIFPVLTKHEINYGVQKHLSITTFLNFFFDILSKYHLSLKFLTFSLHDSSHTLTSNFLVVSAGKKTAACLLNN